MSSYKKLETLVKNFDNVTDEDLNAIIDNENVDVTMLSPREKFSVMVFVELQKALETKDHTLVLDCNYPQSKFHNKTDKELAKGQEPWFRVDYFRLVSKDTRNQSMIQFYPEANVKKGTCNFRLATSCAKCNREQFEALEDELHFVVIRGKDGNAKHTERRDIPYEEVVSAAKSVCAVLATAPKSAAKEEAVKDTDIEESEE